MFSFPVEIWRVIYGYDATFHTEQHGRVMADLGHFFRPCKGYYCGRNLPLRVLFHMNQNARREARMRRHLSHIIDGIDTTAPVPTFEDAMAVYRSIPGDPHVKDTWFSEIKLFRARKPLQFWHHVQILQRLMT